MGGAFPWVSTCFILATALSVVHGSSEVHGGIDEVLDLLNLRRLHSRIGEGKWKQYGSNKNGTESCLAEVSAYLDALRHGVPWANMIYDATGRYSSQFTFGNGFWLGSKTLCLELDNMALRRKAAERKKMEATKIILSSEKHPVDFTTQPPNDDKEQKDKKTRDDDTTSVSPLFPIRQQNPFLVASKSPPYRVRFFIARIELSLANDILMRPRQVLLGVCMPRSCTPKAISQLIDISATEKGYNQSLKPDDSNRRGKSVKVLRVRPVPGDYDWKMDPKVYVLGGVTVVVLVLMVLAEIYESFRSLCHPKVKDLQIQQSRDAEKGKNNNFENDFTKKPKDTSKDSPPSLPAQLLLCFSVRRNGSKILSLRDESGKSDEEHLACLHGLRAVSLAWVIMVHTYLQVFAIAENKKLRTVRERDLGFQTISNATFSVDTFFTISGLLVAFLYFRAKAPKKNSVGGDNNEDSDEANKIRSPRKEKSAAATDTITFFKLLGYRFLRLSPPYLFVIGVAEVGMRWQLNGSVFEPRIADGVNCAKYWWRNALYINSLFPQSEMCMLWSWYMANDTQFYALGIILLLIAVRHFRFAVVAGLVFLASSWITTAVIAIQYDYHVSIPDPFALFDQLYDKPWLRLGPYMIGMFTGWLLYETSFQIRLPKMAVISGWVLAICCMGTLVYGVALVGRPVPPFGGIGLSVMGSAAYASFGHTAWSIAVAWVIVACATGNGGWISGLLCWSVLRPISRLAYCAYLVHPVVMVLTAFRMDGPLHLETSVVVCQLVIQIARGSFKLLTKLMKAWKNPTVISRTVRIFGDRIKETVFQGRKILTLLSSLDSNTILTAKKSKNSLIFRHLEDIRHGHPSTNILLHNFANLR